jgi:three-Cys-motif partner protein
MPAMKGKGGAWTERKLAALRKYIPAFNTALKDKPSRSRPFRRILIDAFAGSGNRELGELPLWKNSIDIAKIAKGSARISLESEPAFDEYIFIEKSAKNVAELQALKAEFPYRNVDIRQGDANVELAKIATTWDRARWRGVLFLDPYGCQVEWSSLSAVANTQAIDVWLLFPVNAVRRMLPRDASFEPGWRERLNLLFGTEAWFEEFYLTSQSGDLFGSSGPTLVREVNLDRIEKYYAKRLQAIFQGGVCKRPLRLGPSNRDPLFSLFFACSNPTEAAKKLAHKIANDILRSG